MNFIKIVYHLIPAKRLIFSILKKTTSLKENTFRHLHFIGVFKVEISKQQSFLLKHYGTGFTMESDFFWKGFGGTEKTSCTVWRKLSEQSTITIDIGANTGIYSLIASCCNPSSTIFAFEPSDKVFDKLKENIKLNSYSITPLRLAVAENSGIVTYFDTNSENPYTGSLKDNLSNNILKKLQVEAISMRDFINKNKIEKIDLMKVDVEEFEPEILKSMKEFLPRFKPAILIEILNNNIADELTEILVGINYHFYNIDENRGLIKTDKLEKALLNNYLICTESMFIKAKLNNLLLR